MNKILIIILNFLLGNRISLVGLNKFLSCIEFQISLGYKNSSNSGLLKLNLFVKLTNTLKNKYKFILFEIEK